jgi:hypothetical protein
MKLCGWFLLVLGVAPVAAQRPVTDELKLDAHGNRSYRQNIYRLPICVSLIAEGTSLQYAWRPDRGETVEAFTCEKFLNWLCLRELTLTPALMVEKIRTLPGPSRKWTNWLMAVEMAVMF